MKTMKKALTVLTALTLIFMLTAIIPASANVNGGYLGDVPRTAVKINVDGERDAIYNYGLAVDVKYEKDREVMATGVVTLLFSDGTLYAYAEVEDSDVKEPSEEAHTTTPWHSDSFEVFINIPNNNNVYDIMQYRIDWTGWPSVYDKNGLEAYGQKAADKYFKYAAKRTAAGYCTEFAIPVDAAGKDIGVNFQINDMYGDDNTLTWAMVYSEAIQTGTDSWAVNIYPYLSLGSYTEAKEDGIVAEPTVPPAEPTAEPGDDDPEATDDTAATAKNNSGENSGKNSGKLSPGLIAAICIGCAVVLALIIALIVVKKRKKA